MLPMLPIFQRTLQFVVLSRPGIKGVLPKGKDRRNTVAVEQGATVNSWIILYFQLAAAGAARAPSFGQRALKMRPLRNIVRRHLTGADT